MEQPQLGRFGDRRLAATGNDLLNAMQQQRTMCLAVLAEDRAETLRFTAFLDNEAVSRHEMLTHAGRLTAGRAAGRHVLAVADTSEFNFATHTGRKVGFGTVGNGKDIGVFVHPIVAVDAESGGIIGLVGAEVINRAQGKVEDLKTRSADQKEVAPVAGRGGDGGRCAERGGHDHHGGGPRRRHLRPVRPPPHQRAPAGASGAKPLGGGEGAVVRAVCRLVGGGAPYDHGAGEARPVWQGVARRANDHRRGAVR